MAELDDLEILTKCCYSFNLTYMLFQQPKEGAVLFPYPTPSISRFTPSGPRSNMRLDIRIYT